MYRPILSSPKLEVCVNVIDGSEYSSMVKSKATHQSFSEEQEFYQEISEVPSCRHHCASWLICCHWYFCLTSSQPAHTATTKFYVDISYHVHSKVPRESLRRYLLKKIEKKEKKITYLWSLEKPALPLFLINRWLLSVTRYKEKTAAEWCRTVDRGAKAVRCPS